MSTAIINPETATRTAKPLAISLYGKFNNREHRHVTVAEALERAEANFTVNKQQMVRVTPEMIQAIRNGEPISGLTANDIIQSHCATSRADCNQTLGVVGKDYTIVQNETAFQFIDFIGEVSNTTPIIETAGVLGCGERMYVSCKLESQLFLDDAKTDAVDQYIVVSNSHDGSGAVLVFFTPVRVICQNTLNFAIAQAKNKLVYKHTKNIHDRMVWTADENRARAKQVFDAVGNFRGAFIDTMRFLKSQTVSDAEVRKFAAKVCLSEKDWKRYKDAQYNLNALDDLATQTKNRIEQLMNSISYGIGQEQHRGTKLWLLNGLTTMYHNDFQWKDTEDEFTNIFGGTANKKLELAAEYLLAA